MAGKVNRAKKVRGKTAKAKTTTVKRKGAVAGGLMISIPPKLANGLTAAAKAAGKRGGAKSYAMHLLKDAASSSTANAS